MISLLSRRVMPGILLLSACLSPLKLFSQTTDRPPRPQDLPTSEKSMFFSAENRWQLKAVDSQAQTDTVAPEVRAKRNAYWQPSLAKYAQLTEGLGPNQGVGVSEPPYLGDAPEIPVTPNAVWVVAQFESFHVYPVDPQNRLLYTEINFRVSQVLRQPSSLSLAPGALLDKGIPGGRVKGPGGAVTSFKLHPERHAYQPGHTYILAGTYDSATQYFDIDKSWDVTSGKVEVVSTPDKRRASKGESKLYGLTVAEAVKYLKSVLP
jgi:hypothetical protein